MELLLLLLVVAEASFRSCRLRNDRGEERSRLDNELRVCLLLLRRRRLGQSREKLFRIVGFQST
jgi:hypothetical protein